MYYELKGKLLEMAIVFNEEEKVWRQNIKNTLKQLDPRIDNFLVEKENNNHE